MHSQYKSVPQNDHQHETEKGDDEDDEDDEEDSEDDGSDDDILAVYGSDSEDEDSHEESGKDESDDMNVPQVYQGSAVTSRSGRQCRPSSRYQDFLA